ncbi:hypothetical protein PFISCL1PPCAC_7792, partial [Pristionchus fissidentatus]
SRLVVMRVALALLALVGCTYSTILETREDADYMPPFSTCECTGFICRTCHLCSMFSPKKNCKTVPKCPKRLFERKTRSPEVDFARVSREGFSCSCFGSSNSCIACFENDCEKVSSCGKRSIPEVREKRGSYSCHCKGFNPIFGRGCTECYEDKCRDVNICPAENGGSEQLSFHPILPPLCHYCTGLGPNPTCELCYNNKCKTVPVQSCPGYKSRAEELVHPPIGAPTCDRCTGHGPNEPICRKCYGGGNCHEVNISSCPGHEHHTEAPEQHLLGEQGPLGVPTCDMCTGGGRKEATCRKCYGFGRYCERVNISSCPGHEHHAEAREQHPHFGVPTCNYCTGLGAATCEMCYSGVNCHRVPISKCPKKHGEHGKRSVESEPTVTTNIDWGGKRSAEQEIPEIPDIPDIPDVTDVPDLELR